MFGIFNKKKNNPQLILRVFSPMSGTAVPVTETRDAVFSQKMVGDGMSIIPSDSKIYAPVDGVLIQVFKTLHAYSIRTSGGEEVLIHCGIETVSLNGNGFISYKSSGDTVAVGDLLGEMDFEFIASQGKDIITPVIITNMRDSFRIEGVPGEIQAGDLLFSLEEH